MIKISISNILITLPFVILLGCNTDFTSIEVTEFEPGFFFYGNNQRIPIFRSNKIVSVKFDSSVTANEAKEISNQFGLSLFYEYYNYLNSEIPNWTELLKRRFIIMILPEYGDVDEYITHYPKMMDISFLGNHPKVEFCMPTFSGEDSGNLFSRLFIGDEFVAKSDSDSVIVHEFSSSYAVYVLRRNQWGEYVLRNSKESPMNTLDMANYFYENKLFVWSHPDFISMIVTEN